MKLSKHMKIASDDQPRQKTHYKCINIQIARFIQSPT